ncbi:HD domain-containing protein [Corynebacterium sp. Q4381]|uniref:HD domain-containing protein n=1 Tax=Corynebacterium sp. Marseille-Q4381 TaxID=3121597 RepID=UPI002FE5415E
MTNTTSFNKEFTASPRLIRAINTAAWAHRGHVRKGTDIPYISHIFGVMHLVSEVTDDEDVLIAALFHDILEDVPEEYSAEEMEADFGPRVVELVGGVTKDSLLPDWQSRADAYLEHLRASDDGSVLISAADKLHNLLSILADHQAIGEDIWARFNSGKERQQWWYRAVSNVASERLPGNPLVVELQKRVAELEAL